MTLESSELRRASRALGPPPPVSYAAAHAYPAAAPAFESDPMAERPACIGDLLRLYVHIPFCNYRCSFCFFAVSVGKSREQKQRYVKAVEKELEWIQEGTPISQLFMGGGTPTTLPPDLLDQMLSAVFARTSRERERVHTVEASPESILPEHVEVLRSHGIGRVSMGLQSFDEKVLDRINRRHSAEDALHACELLVGNGLILNVDLIYGLPGQSERSFADDFERLVQAGVQSITAYDLRLNERTPVSRSLAEQEFMALSNLTRWRSFVRNLAKDNNYTQTRWHTFKRLDTVASGHERAPHHHHNGSGFQFGAGLSARSHLGYAVYRNHANLTEYLERVESGQSPVEGTIPLDAEDRKTQFVTRSLGDGKTMSRDRFEEAFSISLDDEYGPLLRRLKDGDLITDDGETVALTEMGRLLYDQVTYQFYPKRALQWMSERRPPARSKVAPS